MSGMAGSFCAWFKGMASRSQQGCMIHREENQPFGLNPGVNKNEKSNFKT